MYDAAGRPAVLQNKANGMFMTGWDDGQCGYMLSTSGSALIVRWIITIIWIVRSNRAPSILRRIGVMMHEHATPDHAGARHYLAPRLPSFSSCRTGLHARCGPTRQRKEHSSRKAHGPATMSLLLPAAGGAAGCSCARRTARCGTAWRTRDGFCGRPLGGRARVVQHTPTPSNRRAPPSDRRSQCRLPARTAFGVAVAQRGFAALNPARGAVRPSSTVMETAAADTGAHKGRNTC